MEALQSDEELIIPLRGGSSKALEVVFHRYRNVVFNIALSYVQSREDAEEITQDVFVEVFQSVSDFKGNASLKTWICRITVNKSLDHLRYKNRKKRFAVIASLFSEKNRAAVPQPMDFHHPGVTLENKEKTAYLFKAIDALPENQKTVLILLKIEGLSQKEVSRIMQLGEKAVESLFQRAKANLRKQLENIYEELK